MNPLMELLSGVGYVLDTPGSLARGVLAGRPGERVGGRDLLEAWGMAGPNEEGLDAGDIAGFGAEMLLDPLNLVGGGWLAKTAKARWAVQDANKASQGLRAMGAMPEEIVSKLHPLARQTVVSAKPGAEGKLSGIIRSWTNDIDDPAYAAEALSGSDADIVARHLDDINKSGEFEPTLTGEHPWIDEALSLIETKQVPRKFYHGTPTPGIEARDLSPDFVGTATDPGAVRGVYFTPSVEHANQYAGREGGAVVQAYLDMRDPWVSRGGIGKPTSYDPYGTVVDASRDEATRSLQRRGYDSAIMDSADAEFVPFSQSQIYAPYVAPALQQPPSYRNPLAALLAAQLGRAHPEY